MKGSLNSWLICIFALVCLGVFAEHYTDKMASILTERPPLIVKVTPASPVVVSQASSPPPVDAPVTPSEFKWDIPWTPQQLMSRVENESKTLGHLQGDVITLTGQVKNVPLPAVPIGLTGDDEFYLNLARKSSIENTELVNECYRRLVSLETRMSWIDGLHHDGNGGLKKLDAIPEKPERLRWPEKSSGVTKQ